VLIARASGRPFDVFLRERVFEPLAMRDTGFFVPEQSMSRFGPCFGIELATGALGVFDPRDGQWSRPPAFPGGGAGLVSTIDDYAAFAGMLLGGGTGPGTRLLSGASVAAMTTNQLTPEQVEASGPMPRGQLGWGFGVGVQLTSSAGGASVGAYGWDGGLGSRWMNDPTAGCTCILLTNQMWTSPTAPPVAEDLVTCAYAAFDR